MDEYDLYPTDLSAEEAAAMFQRVVIPDVRQREGEEDLHFVTAVAYIVDETDRILKLRAPDGIVIYLYQRFGVFQELPNSEPDWLPIAINAHVSEAMRTMPRHRADTTIVPVLPPMAAAI